MILGIFPPQGGSLSSLRRTGQDTRFIRSYLGNYARRFEEVYYFSYADEETDLPPNCHLIKNPGYHRWAYAFLLPLVQREYVRQCDVLRVMQMYGAIPAIVAKLLYGKPYVGTYGYRYLEHARTRETWLRALLFEWRAWLGLKLADGAIVTTDALEDYVTRFVPQNRVTLIPNGVDTELFYPVDARQEREEKTAICVGRLAPQKNLFMLIEAIALIQQLKIRLVLVGDGELREPLEKHATEKGVSLELVGVVPHEKLPRILHSADVFVLPSLREGHPKALLEAMSCGLPCVGANVEGIGEVIHHNETGLLCDLTAQSLADGIAQPLSDQELAGRLGDQARRFIQESYNLNSLLGREIDTLKAVATGSSRSSEY